MPLEGLLRARQRLEASPRPLLCLDLMTAPFVLGTLGVASNGSSSIPQLPQDLTSLKLRPGSWIPLTTQTCTFPTSDTLPHASPPFSKYRDQQPPALCKRPLSQRQKVLAVVSMATLWPQEETAV